MRLAGWRSRQMLTKYAASTADARGQGPGRSPTPDQESGSSGGQGVTSWPTGHGHWVCRSPPAIARQRSTDV